MLTITTKLNLLGIKHTLEEKERLVLDNSEGLDDESEQLLINNL